MSTMTKRERLEAAIRGEATDRVPVALWRHFPGDDYRPEDLAASTVGFQRRYDFDFVKVTPASSFSVADWGVRDEWRGNEEGTRVYTHYADPIARRLEAPPRPRPARRFLGRAIQVPRPHSP